MKENDYLIRMIKDSDAIGTLNIYKPYVEKTIISFEYEVPTLSEWQNRIETNTSKYPWLVCEYENEIIGYAYGSTHRYRTAYSWSPESTVYMSDKFHRKGIARTLYNTLFELLRMQGYVNVFAGVGLPNEKSERFHLALGFQEIGVFKKIGFKLGNWHDTRWFQYLLTDYPMQPDKPKTLKELDAEEVNKVLATANQTLVMR